MRVLLSPQIRNSNVQRDNSNSVANIVKNDIEQHNDLKAYQNCAVNNIAFHGLFSGEPDTEEKISAAAYELDNQSILVLAKDFKSAKESLNIYSSTLDFPLVNVFFIPDENVKCPIAMFKDKDDKYNLFNIGFWTLDIRNQRDSWGSKSRYNIGRGQFKQIHSGDYFSEVVISKDDKSIFQFKGPKKNTSSFNEYVERYSLFDNPDMVKKFNANRMFNLGKSEKQTPEIKGTSLTFADIGGQKEVIKQLQEEVICPIKYPEFFNRARINKGILLYGPPRCGKSMLGQAIANEVNATFIKVNADDLTTGIVGTTEANWRELFKQAIDSQPTIIFIDEFDAVSKHRTGTGENARYQDGVVSQILNLMSDLEKSEANVFVIAATNNKSVIDKAMLGTGRFGAHIEVMPPDLEGTKEIFRIHTKKVPIANDFNADEFCGKLNWNNFNGSEITEVVTKACFEALRRLNVFEKMLNNEFAVSQADEVVITDEDFQNAFEKLNKQKKDL